MRLVLYQPDIPQNAGALLRLGACLGVPLDLVEPAGFLIDDRRLARSAMDYAAAADLTRHASWARYLAGRAPGRLVLLTTRAETRHLDFVFRADDALLLGQESSGVPPQVRAVCDAEVRVPIRPGLRSLNVALAAALVLGEALRQTKSFPEAA
ncbi:MAG: tRNA (cytidine(34)-2'-O)-methyltransferase [Alphaproteobacteria bacterium]|nr:tRNA (cytidine(34)-2'-O)-methyltransferase [Alphaproteobacteria bacterium]